MADHAKGDGMTLKKQKRQLNVRTPEITRQQIDSIAAIERMTAGEVVTLAVDRLYREHYQDRGTAPIPSSDVVVGSWE